MAKSRRYYIRKTHRYLGVILGIQFMVWTISGIYFSWTNIDDIHGDFQHKQPRLFSGNFNLVSPAVVLQNSGYTPDSIVSIQAVNILRKPFYYVQFFSGKTLVKVLGDATTGIIRPSIAKHEAMQIAAESFNGTPKVKSVEYITSANSHHEYREKPLPAWAVSFNHPTETTVYVSAADGKVQSFRNNKWRVFDFLWMGHTMDYKSRDNINNWLLRIFSAFGLLTILSGFILFWISSKRLRRKRTQIVRLDKDHI